MKNNFNKQTIIPSEQLFCDSVDSVNVEAGVEYCLATHRFLDFPVALWT